MSLDGKLVFLIGCRISGGAAVTWTAVRVGGGAAVITSENCKPWLLGSLMLMTPPPPATPPWPAMLTKWSSAARRDGEEAGKERVKVLDTGWLSPPKEPGVPSWMEPSLFSMTSSTVTS
jgi:hypothetical protein